MAELGLIKNEAPTTMAELGDKPHRGAWPTAYGTYMGGWAGTQKFGEYNVPHDVRQ